MRRSFNSSVNLLRSREAACWPGIWNSIYLSVISLFNVAMLGRGDDEKLCWFQLTLVYKCNISVTHPEKTKFFAGGTWLPTTTQFDTVLYRGKYIAFISLPVLAIIERFLFLIFFLCRFLFCFLSLCFPLTSSHDSLPYTWESWGSVFAKWFPYLSFRN